MGNRIINGALAIGCGVMAKVSFTASSSLAASRMSGEANLAMLSGIAFVVGFLWFVNKTVKIG